MTTATGPGAAVQLTLDEVPTYLDRVAAARKRTAALLERLAALGRQERQT